MIFSLCFSMVSYFLLSVVLKQYQYQLHELNYGLYLFNEGLALVLIFYGLYLIKKENAGYQARILAKNQALHEKHVQIQIQANQLQQNADQLGRQAEELRELNSLKNKLFSVISHDLKTPLYALRNMFANVQQNNMSAIELRKMVPDVMTDLNYTVGLMDNLLQWAKTQMQTDRVRPQDVNIGTSISDVLQLLRLQAKAKQIRIRNLAKGDIYGYMDKDMMSLVLRNLISNAIKFTPRKGSVLIGVNDHPSFIEIYVKDSGSGISSEAMSKLTRNDFYTTKGTANESGTGLGLMLCREFIARNGGQLHIESEKGKGSIFSFSLPKTA
jgi:signal transduction histidine kinase